MTEQIAFNPAVPAQKYNSMIIFEIKPLDEDTNLTELAQKITQLQIDGLAWIKNWQLLPIAYGLKKLQIACYIVDSKVSVDDITYKIESFQDDVQSVDIAAFQKI